MFRVLFLILVLMSSTAFAQTEDNSCRLPRPTATKIDEFSIITDVDFKTQIDSFYTELLQNLNSQGYIINYGSEDEVATREKLIQESLGFRKFDAGRITIVRGGEAEIPKTEFWIVPPGADNPTPDYDNSNRTELTQSKTFVPYRLEEFGQVSDRFLKWIFSEFLGKLEKEQTLKGYILIRGSEEDMTVFEERIRNLESFQKFNSDQIIFIKSEARGQSTVALWFVPNEAELPEELITK